MKLYDSYPLILLHKIDLIDPLYLAYKIKAINEYLNKILHEKNNIAIYNTSIAKDFFFDMYDLFTEIFTNLFRNRTIIMDKSLFQTFKIDLKIIMKYNESKSYRLINLYHDFNLSFDKAKFHLKRLF